MQIPEPSLRFHHHGTQAQTLILGWGELWPLVSFLNFNKTGPNTGPVGPYSGSERVWLGDFL